MGFRVKEVLQTPNPNAAKFVLDRPISEATLSFLNAAEAEGHPVAKQFFAINGVASLMLLGDFVTVNKTPAVAWPAIKKQVKQILAEI